MQNEIQWREACEERGNMGKAKEEETRMDD